MLIAGFFLVLIPFRGYLGTDEVRVERGRVEIPLSALPADRVREVAWNRERLFITNGDRPVVLVVGYEGGAYVLPDGSATGGHVRCGLFGSVGERFRCMDPDTPADWRGRAVWSRSGEPLGEGFPALRSIAYRIAGNTLVITAMEEPE